jgi:phosphatidylserine/phosphatidylglycerophosphate/cardiolipin synthase-like enzyme
MAFDNLTSGALEILATAAESGALRAPFSAGGLARWLAPREAQSAAGGLATLGTLSAEPLACVLRMLADERRRAAERRTPVDLVWTGPDTPGVASRDTAVVVRHLFQAAQHSVLVSSFAVAQGEQVFAALAEHADAQPELRVRLVLNVARPHQDGTPADELRRRFAAEFFGRHWPGTRRPEIYYDPRALEPSGPTRAVQHSKCVVIDDREALVTSANFTEAAQERNIEAGVLVREPAFARQLREHFDALIEAGALVRL